MSVKDICEKIMSEAVKECAVIMDNFRKEADSEAKVLYDNWINKEKPELLLDIDSKIKKAKSKSLSLARMEGSRALLKTKSVILNEFLDAIVVELSSISSKEYEDMMFNMLKSVPFDNAKIYIAESKEHSSKGALKRSEKNFELMGFKDIKGGFIAESSNESYDASFETIVNKMFKDNIEKVLIKDLFSKFDAKND